MDAVEVWTLAENLGSVESLITHPATMTHAGISPEERERLGILDGLVRASVGLEDPEDLIEDLGQGTRPDLSLLGPARGTNGSIPPSGTSR